MKNNILMLLLFLISQSYSQKKSVYVIYGVKVNDDKLLSKPDPNDPFFEKVFNYTKLNDHRFRFGLIINNQTSKFYDIPQLETQDGMLESVSLNLMCYTGIIFQTVDFVYTHYPLQGENVYCRGKQRTNWVLTNESKMIDNYLCYKATNVNRIEHKSINKVFNHPIVAWYCPKLPFPHGPNGYGNLPGLILELQVRNVVYGVKEIDLNSNSNFDTDFITKKTIVTEDELNRRIQEDAENWGK